MKILIGTKNPGKIEGAREALKKYFEDFDIEGIPVSSDVSEEPVNNEIYEGARNIVNNLIEYAKRNGIEAEYFLGVESGTTNSLGIMVINNMAIIKDKYGYESLGTSRSIPVSNEYVHKIISTEIDLTKEAFIMALDQYTNQVRSARKILKKNDII